MRTAMEQGRVNCMASMASVVDEAKAHLVAPEETVFYEPFKNMTGNTGHSLNEHSYNISDKY